MGDLGPGMIACSSPTDLGRKAAALVGEIDMMPNTLNPTLQGLSKCTECLDARQFTVESRSEGMLYVGVRLSCCIVLV